MHFLFASRNVNSKHSKHKLCFCYNTLQALASVGLGLAALSGPGSLTPPQQGGCWWTVEASRHMKPENGSEQSDQIHCCCCCCCPPVCHLLFSSVCLVCVSVVGGGGCKRSRWGGGLMKQKVTDCHSGGKRCCGLLRSGYVLHASAGKMSSYAGGSSLGSG